VIKRRNKVKCQGGGLLADASRWFPVERVNSR
jgi:hypothetical protein